MSKASLEWYMVQIKQEITRKIQEGFTGNIDFKINFVSGGIVNMNMGINKSVKCLDSLTV